MSTHVQPALFELPESTPRHRSLGDVGKEWRTYRRVCEDEGGLVSSFVVQKMLGISRQRVAQLVASRKLSRWEFFGQTLFSCHEVEAMARAKRDGSTRYEKG